MTQRTKHYKASLAQLRPGQIIHTDQGRMVFRTWIQSNGEYDVLCGLCPSTGKKLRVLVHFQRPIHCEETS